MPAGAQLGLVRLGRHNKTHISANLNTVSLASMYSSSRWRKKYRVNYLGRFADQRGWAARRRSSVRVPALRSARSGALIVAISHFADAEPEDGPASSDRYYSVAIFASRLPGLLHVVVDRHPAAAGNRHPAREPVQPTSRVATSPKVSVSSSSALRRTAVPDLPRRVHHASADVSGARRGPTRGGRSLAGCELDGRMRTRRIVGRIRLRGKIVGISSHEMDVPSSDRCCLCRHY